MIKLVKIINSPVNNKKKRAIFSNGKQIDFGATGYEDFTTHKDPSRRDRYDIRHRKREDWNNPFTAGALAKYILWNKPTLEASIADYKQRFNL